MNKKKLIIVESPTKCKTIGKILGSEYKLTSTLGHIRDLPKRTIGVDVSDNFKPSYEVSPEKQKVVKGLVADIKKSEDVYIATDEDREGEAIGWHVVKAAHIKEDSVKRITFHEITSVAIKAALKTPRTIDKDLVNAQQARRILDRLVGYKISPLVGRAIYKGLSAGRVQSAALRIIVEREREIEKFVKQEYWSIKAELRDRKTNTPFTADFISKAGKKYKKLDIKKEAEALALIEGLDKEEFVVEDIEKKERKKYAPPPFITSTLQQAASRQLGFSSKKTMFVAQNLYEGISIGHETAGLITYMRTDSPSIAKPARDTAAKYITQNFGQKYSATKNFKAKAKGAQEAHECIRPTVSHRHPASIKEFLSNDQYKLYNLIWRRFMASQMKEALFDQELVTLTASDTIWHANGEVLIFDGFLKIYNEDGSKKDTLLPKLEKNEVVDIDKIVPAQHFTEPPPRYTEATLIKTLEANGVGRPSTYAPTISTLLARKYVRLEKKRFMVEKVGVDVTELLEKFFPNIVDIHFTAKMEKTLDKVAEGKEKWVEMLADFYGPFHEDIEKTMKELKEHKTLNKVGRKCPECGEDLVKRASKYGEFVGCSAYPQCKYVEHDKKEGANAEEDTDIKLEPCPKCGSRLAVKNGRYGKFIACTGYPKCRYIRSLEEEKIDKVCPECGKPLAVRFSKRGKFLGCTGYPKCKHLEQIPKKNE